ncbi:MAG: HlyD family efflux transporter periplasmic adaptor subunit [Chloroflexota bacterium]
MKKQIILLFVLGLSLLLAACGTKTDASTPTPTAVPASAVIAEGHLVPRADAALSFQARGTVTEVLVEAGDRVRAGDVLARLGAESDSAYAAAMLELTGAQQALDDLVESADAARAQALIALDKAEEDYDDAKDYREALDEEIKYERVVVGTVMTPGGPVRVPQLKTYKTEADEETIADADANLALKKALFEEAQRAYERMQDGPDEDQLALLEARLNAARAAVAAFAVTAPFDGVVMDVNVGVGKQVGPETWAVKVADTSAWYVETSDLTELEVVKISVGQPVTIVADALPDAPMTGVVESISQAFTSSGGDILYEVKIKVDEIDPRALWGMTVEVTFEPSE